MMQTPTPVLTVSQLNKQVKTYLEIELGTVFVEGEISNLSKPASGHFYFTLKDQQAQIRCVFFKNRHTTPFAYKLDNGQQVIASGKLSLYEARGDYQLIVEELTEAGLGALYQQFEELKKRLAAEGLFNPERKKPIPTMPKSIGVITSTSGAAIRDILSTLARRYPVAKVFIYPSEVQGISAPQQLIHALERANQDQLCDVLILARGGGSIEDLWAFNHEQLARTIATSSIPIVSGVGHETDFTIADFVADYRAETPTAAAAAVTPDGVELANGLRQLELRLSTVMHRIIQNQQLKLHHLIDKISSPEKTIATYWQTVDYLERQLHSNLAQIMNRKKHLLQMNLMQLNAMNPKTKVQHTQTHVRQLCIRLMQQMNMKINQLKHQLGHRMATLHAVSPLATLDRGYAIATKNQHVVFNTGQIAVGDSIQVRLAKGSLACEVTAIQEE